MWIKMQANSHLYYQTLKEGFLDWLSLDMPTLIYMAKAILAACSALIVSMILTLPDPRTAIFTSFIVMQPQSGLVFSKSYYRVLGTIAGVIVSVLMVGAFAQEPLWFIFFLALWIGITTAAGVKYRNFQSYGFVLAGYTLCIVALPVIEHPMDIFDIATSRFSEVMVGILCATIVSDLVFPRKLSNSLHVSERERFENVVKTLQEFNLNTQMQQNADVTKFSSGVVGVHAVAINSAFESGIDKRSRLSLEQLNIEFMHLSTTYHSLENIMQNSQTQMQAKHKKMLQELYLLMGDALRESANLDKAKHKAIKEAMGLHVKKMDERFKTDLDLQSYDLLVSACYLIMRLFDEFFIYSTSYFSFLKRKDFKKESHELRPMVRFKTHTDNLLLLLAALRGSGVLLVSMLFWILSGWKYGTITVTMAVVISLLIGTLPRPLDAVMNFLKGAVSAAVVAAVYDFYIVPEFTSDIYTLCLVIVPVLAFVGWMTTKPKWTGFSLGFVFLFMSQSSFDLFYKIDPTTFLETTIASLLGVTLAGVAYLLVNFWSCSLSQKRVAKLLRAEIVYLCNAPLNLHRGSLESMGRDMVQQFSTQGRLNVRSNRLVYEWLLVTLEIGGALMRVRKKMKNSPAQFKDIELLLEAIKEYFQTPSEALKQKMLTLLVDARKSLHVSQEVALMRTILLSKIAIPVMREDMCS